MSPRWVSEKLCAEAESGAPQKAKAASAATVSRNEGIDTSFGDGGPVVSE
jgi:hypothetical protein